MLKHEFGNMQKNPPKKKRFDSYTPDKYKCISIDDIYIEPIFIGLQKIDCYWHTLQRPEKGLAYYGITLIPPQSMSGLIEILVGENKEEYAPLISLALKAQADEKYIIHFGI